MRIFKDTKDRPWTVAVNVDAVKRVKARVEIDLLRVGSGDANLIVELADNPIMLVDVLFALCEPEAKAAGVTDEDFGKAMAGQAIDDATDALMAELSDFFPKGRRALLKAGLAKVNAGMAMVSSRAVQKLEAFDVAGVVEKAMADAEASISSTTSPGRSGSTPDASPSAS